MSQRIQNIIDFYELQGIFTIPARTTSYSQLLKKSIAEIIPLNQKKFDIVKLSIKAPDYSQEKYYQANYDFITDKLDAIPSGWTDNSGTDCSAKIIASQNGHNKILQLYDNDNSGTYQAKATLSHTNITTKPTYEFWLSSSDTTKQTTILIGSSDNPQEVILRIENGYFGYYDSGMKNLVPVANDEWIHVKVVCKLNGYYDIYVNKILYKSNAVGLGLETSKFNQFSIQTSTTEYGYSVYLNALGLNDSNESLTINNVTYSFGDNYFKKELIKMMDVKIDNQSIVDDLNTIEGFLINDTSVEHKVLTPIYDNAGFIEILGKNEGFQNLKFYLNIKGYIYKQEG